MLRLAQAGYAYAAFFIVMAVQQTMVGANGVRQPQKKQQRLPARAPGLPLSHRLLSVLPPMSLLRA